MKGMYCCVVNNVKIIDYTVKKTKLIILAYDKVQDQTYFKGNFAVKYMHSPIIKISGT